MPAPTFEQWYKNNLNDLNRYGLSSEKDARMVYETKLKNGDFDRTAPFYGPNVQIPIRNEKEDKGYNPVAFDFGSAVEDYNRRHTLVAPTSQQSKNR